MERTISRPRPRAQGRELSPLLKAIAGGDRAALSILYERTNAKLYGICSHLLGNEAEAEAPRAADPAGRTALQSGICGRASGPARPPA